VTVRPKALLFDLREICRALQDSRNHYPRRRARDTSTRGRTVPARWVRLPRAGRPGQGPLKDYNRYAQVNLYSPVHTTVVGSAGPRGRVPQIRTLECTGVADSASPRLGYKGHSHPSETSSGCNARPTGRQETNYPAEFIQSLKATLEQYEVFILHAPQCHRPSAAVGALPPLSLSPTLFTPRSAHRCIGVARQRGVLIPLEGGGDV